MGVALLLNINNRCFVPSSVENLPSGSGKDFFFLCVFLLFRNNLSLEKSLVLFFEQTWIPATKGCFGSEEEDFLIFFFFILFVFDDKIFADWFRNYLSLDKIVALYLNKLESPLPKEVLCQVWLNLARWFWRFRQYIFAFS